MNHDTKIARLREQLADKDLGTLRALEEVGAGRAKGPDEELVLEAINLELAARIAAELGDSITVEEFKLAAAAERNGAELIEAYRRDKVGAAWPKNINRGEV